MTFFQRWHPGCKQVHQWLRTTNYQGRTNQNYNDIWHHTLEWLLLKRQELTDAGKDAEQKEPLCSVSGNITWCSHYGKLYEVSSKVSEKRVNYFKIELAQLVIHLEDKKQLPCKLKIVYVFKTFKTKFLINIINKQKWVYGATWGGSWKLKTESKSA